MQHKAITHLSLALVAMVGVSSAFNLGADPAWASSHREAPLISQDPAADATDLYAFVSPDAPNTVTMIASYYPMQDPAGFPNYYRFGDDVTYRINIDNNGDALEDIFYQWTFDTEIVNPASFLYQSGPIESLDSANLNVRQTYTLSEGRGGVLTEIASGLMTPPANIGPKSTPDYDALADAAIAEVGDGIKVFAGQRDDPFWVDLGGVGDLLTIRQLPGNAGGGVDDLAGLNVQALAIQVPINQLTKDGEVPAGPEADDAVIGVWTTALRESTKVLWPGTFEDSGPLVQVSRLGMPLVNEVVAPLGAKDLFNGSHPGDDAQFLGAVTDPELARLLNLLYGSALVPVPESGRDDLVTVFLTGVPGLNQPANVKPSEMLRLNVAIPPSAEENPLGVIGGDNAGFPNGRRLGDEVVDIELRVAAGFLLGEEFQQGANGQLGDGVPANDVPFMTTFPYVAAPHQGFEHMHHTPDGMAAGSMDMSHDMAAPEARTLTVPLNELGGSGLSGEATLTETADGTMVSLMVDGPAGDNPVHVHFGACDNLGEVAVALTNIDANGESETVIPLTLDELTGEPYAINAHESAENIANYVACGDITG
ncbi:MAG: DUF4331 domain-containing protein [Thermomicrobiales bacterium]